MNDPVLSSNHPVTTELQAPDEDPRSDGSVEISVVVTVRNAGQTESIEKLYRDYRRQLEKVGRAYEFIFVLEGEGRDVLEGLRRLKEEGEPIVVLIFARSYGDATVLTAGFDRARGDTILTLPAYHQVDPAVIPRLIEGLNSSDMVVVRRKPRVDGALTQIQVKAFHAVLRGLLQFEFHDLSCAVRAFRADVVDTVHLYGDQHRFFPVLASHYGYRVTEIEAPQTEHDTFQKHFSFNTYFNRALDLLSVFFLTSFTRKPLRFFGVPGVVVFGGGVGLTSYLTYQRLFVGEPLADRPLLLLGILLIVLGSLFFSIGLIGEMIIFTNADEVTEYTVDQVIE